MPHISPLSNAEAESEACQTLQTLELKLGQVPCMYRTLAHAPKIVNAVVSMAQSIRIDLEANIRELAYLKVIQMTDCHVWRHYHEPVGRRAGITDEQLRELCKYETSGIFSETEKDILRFTEQWTNVGRVQQEVMARLSKSLTAKELVILAAVVAQANLTCRFNNVFGVELPWFVDYKFIIANGCPMYPFQDFAVVAEIMQAGMSNSERTNSAFMTSVKQSVGQFSSWVSTTAGYRICLVTLGYQFIAMIDSCSTAASGTHSKYGTWARAVHR